MRSELAGTKSARHERCTTSGGTAEGRHAMKRGQRQDRKKTHRRLASRRVPSASGAQSVDEVSPLPVPVSLSVSK